MPPPPDYWSHGWVICYVHHWCRVQHYWLYVHGQLAFNCGKTSEIIPLSCCPVQFWESPNMSAARKIFFVVISSRSIKLTTHIWGDRGSPVVKVLCYKSEGRWFDPSWCQWIFHWHKILLITLWPWGWLGLYQKWVPGVFPGGKGGRCIRLTTYHHPVPLLRNLGTLTSWNPLGLSRPLMGLLYLFTHIWCCQTTDGPLLNVSLTFFAVCHVLHIIVWPSL